MLSEESRIAFTIVIC